MIVPASGLAPSSALSIPFVQALGNGRAEECVSLLDFSNRPAYTVSAGLFDQIAHRAGIDRCFDIGYAAERPRLVSGAGL